MTDGDIILDCICETGCGSRLYLELDDEYGTLLLAIGYDNHSDTKRRSVVVRPQDVCVAIKKMVECGE